MENQQNRQQTIVKPLTLEDEAKKVKRQEQIKLANSYFFRKLIQRHPKLVLLGVSTFILFAISFSLASIFQVELFKQEIATTSVATTNHSNTSPSTDRSLPWWLLGAVTLGATVGGVAIAKRLANSSSNLSLFFSQLQSTQPKQQFPPLRQSILSLSALKPSEPKPTWVNSSLKSESQVNIYAETDEFIVLIEESLSDNEAAIFLEAVDLTAEEKNLIIEDMAVVETSESSPQMLASLADVYTSEIASNLAPENDSDLPCSRSLVEMLDLRQKISLAALLEIDQ